MSNRSKIIIIISTTVFLVVMLAWEGWSIYMAQKIKPVVIQETGLLELQSAVKIWKQKQPFSLDGASRVSTKIWWSPSAPGISPIRYGD